MKRLQGPWQRGHRYCAQLSQARLSNSNLWANGASLGRIQRISASVPNYYRVSDRGSLRTTTTFFPATIEDCVRIALPELADGP